MILGFLQDIVRGAAAWRSATAGMTQNVTAREWVDSTKPTGDDVPKSRLDTSRGQK